MRREADATRQREAVERGKRLIGPSYAVASAQIVPEDKPGDAREQPQQCGKKGKR
jgi:hypothetical protein